MRRMFVRFRSNGMGCLLGLPSFRWNVPSIVPQKNLRFALAKHSYQLRSGLAHSI